MIFAKSPNSWYNRTTRRLPMPQIMPIRDLKNTAEISAICHEKNEPIFITKNGYGDMVIMSMENYEKIIHSYDIHAKIAEAEADIVHGNVKNADSALQELRLKYDV